MNVELFVAFCLAVTVLILMPGPIDAMLAGRARNWFIDPKRQRLQAQIRSLLIATGLSLLLARRASQ